jgi:hypothetical protein
MKYSKRKVKVVFIKFIESIHSFYLAGTLSLLLFSISCSSPKLINTSLKVSTYCEPSIQYTYSSYYLPIKNIDSIIQSDSSLTNRFAEHDIILINAVGILPLLQELIRYQDDLERDTRLEQIIIFQQIQNRLMQASTEISSIVAELDCEGERAEQLANYLDIRDENRIKKLTILSIVVGSGVTVAGALISNNKTDDIISVAGGLLSAGLGGAAAFSSKLSIPYQHNRNQLTAIWEDNNQSSIYSPFIWYVLNEPLFSNTKQISIRQNLSQRWKDYVLNKTSIEEQNLYFGSGGNYKSTNLHARANMLNQLQASIRSINQNLQNLIANLPQPRIEKN